MAIKKTWLNWMKVIIDDRSLSFGAKSMGLYLNTFMNDSHDMAFPSLRYIEGEMSLTRKTALKYLGELEVAGYIKKGKILNPSTNQYHNTYTAQIPEGKLQFEGGGAFTPPREKVVEILHEGGGNYDPKVVEHLHPNNQGNKQRNKQDTARGETSVPKYPPCPYQRIVDLYHELLPMCPRVVQLSDHRKRAMRARWQNGSNELEWWQAYFEHVSESRFLTGRVDPAPGRKQFIADIDFLIRENTIIKTQEGKYHG